MSDKKKQKFSLSDIIRKLNESSTDEAGPPVSISAETPPNNAPPRTSLEYKEASEKGVSITPLDRDAAAPLPPAPTPHVAPEIPPDPSRPHDDAESGDFDIMRYVSIVVRRKNIIIAAMIVAAFFSVSTYVKAVRLYTAHARMLFSPGYQDIMGNNQGMFLAWGSREEKLNTHLELLKSQTVLKRVAENLGDNISPGSMASALKITRGGNEGEKTDIVDLTFSHVNAETARDVANEVCKTYIEYIKEVNVQDITRLILKLDDQIGKVEKDLDKKEDALRVFKENNRTVQLSNETNIAIAKLSQVETARQQTELDMLEGREKFIGLKKEIDQQEVDVIQSMTYQNPYQNRLAELELQLNTLSAEYSPEHYKVRMIKAEIDKIKDAMKSDIIKEAASKTFVKNPIRQSLLQELINVTIEKSALDAKRNAQEQIGKQLYGDLQKLPATELQFAQLTRETESLLQVLKLLKNRYEEAKIKRDSQDSDLKILEWAPTPSIAVSNAKSSKILITILIGLIIGVALAFLLEYLDQSIKEPLDIERTLELPLLGIVPMIETEKAIIESSKNRGKTVLEPFRALRANVKHIAEQRNAKTFIVSSAVKGEGKTTLAANIAITFAMDGKKVILVDGDLRRAQMHGLFHLEKKNGLCDYLQGASEIQDILKPTVHHNLFVITAGEHPQNPAELVGSYRFGLLVKELRTMADFIIFDSPALLPVSDVLSMAPKMDACIMVVRALWTPLKAAQQAKIQLKRIGCTIIGGILNGISHSRGYYPYYYGYYRYYAYKYSYEDDQRSRFSMRQFGLSIESKFKEYVQSAGLSIPRWIASIRSNTRHLFQRKIFWILFIIAIFLPAAERAVHHSGFRILPKRTVTYLGDERTSGTNKTKEQERAPSARDQATMLKADSSMTTAGLSSDSAKTAADTLKIPEIKSDTLHGLDQLGLIKNSLFQWQRAFNSKDIQRYLAYYDSSRFQYPGGDYAAWKSEVATYVLLSGPRNRSIHIDSMWQDTFAPPYITVSLNISARSSGAIAHKRYTMVWQRARSQWKIIREKQRDL